MKKAALIVALLLPTLISTFVYPATLAVLGALYLVHVFFTQKEHQLKVAQDALRQKQEMADDLQKLTDRLSAIEDKVGGMSVAAGIRPGVNILRK